MEEEMQRRPSWKPRRSGGGGGGVPGRRRGRNLARVPGRPAARLRGLQSELKNNEAPKGKNLKPLLVIRPTFLHCFAFNFTLFFYSCSSYYCDYYCFYFFFFFFFFSLPPRCCFLVCFPSALLWLSPSATATFKGAAVTRCL